MHVVSSLGRYIMLDARATTLIIKLEINTTYVQQIDPWRTIDAQCAVKGCHDTRQSIPIAYRDTVRSLASANRFYYPRTGEGRVW